MKLNLKIGLIVGASIVGTVTLASTMVALSVINSLEHSIGDNQNAITKQTIDKLDRFLYERQIDIQLISSDDQLTSAIDKPTKAEKAAIVADLNGIKTFDGVWNSLSMIDKAGATIVTTDAQSSPRDAVGGSYAQLLARTLSGESASSDVFADPSGQPTMLYMAPIRDPAKGGQVIGAMAGELAWPAVLEILKGVTTSDLKLVNQSGLVIGTNERTDTDILRKDWSKSAFYRAAVAKNTTNPLTLDESGSSSLSSQTLQLVSFAQEPGYLDFQGNHWYLILTTPTAVAFAPARTLARQLFYTLGIALLLGLAGVLLFMNRQVLGPIHKLSLGLDRIAGGDWAWRVEIKSKDELGILAGAFNTMASQLSFASEQLRQSNAQLQASILSIPLGFMLTNDKNRIISVNPAMHKLVGDNFDFEAIKNGAPLPKLLSDILTQSQECLATSKPGLHNFTTNSGRFLRMFFSPVIDHGRTIGVVSLVEDITEAKVLERSKDEFFSIASHELRTPLTAIRGNASMLKDMGSKLKKSEVADMVTDIHQSSVRLIEIVNDFLDASRLEQGKMEFKTEDFDIHEVVEGVVYEMGAIIKERKLYFKSDQTLGVAPRVRADKNRVKQILYNLTGNALRFTQDGGITVRAAVEGDYLRVSVIDTGSGIPADKQMLLFHKFQQAGASLYTRDTTRGTGLGLYISRLLVEHMGGELALDQSEPEHGSTFSFTLPLAPEAKGS